MLIKEEVDLIISIIEATIALVEKIDPAAESNPIVSKANSAINIMKKIGL